MIDPKALYYLTQGLYLVTSHSGEKINAQTATTVVQVSSDPAQIAVVINKNNLTHEYISESNVFGVCVLSKDAPLEYVFKFGFFSGRKLNKFENLQFQLGSTGLPFPVPFVAAFLEAEVVSKLDVGTHTIFVGKLAASKIMTGDEPLTYAFYRIKKEGLTPTTAPTYQK